MREIFCVRKLVFFVTCEAFGGQLDSTQTDDFEELLPIEDSGEEKEEVPEPDIHSLAQQNGHHSESKKIL